MELCGVTMQEKWVDGKYCIQPTEKIDVTKFQEILRLVKTNGGVYSRSNGFVFEKKVEFKAEKVVPQETVKVKKEVKELNKPENKVPEKEVPKEAVEYEVYEDPGMETCLRHIQDLIKEKADLGEPDHEKLLNILAERIKTDAELRANILHKDYDKMLVDGARTWCTKNKKQTL